MSFSEHTQILEINRIHPRYGCTPCVGQSCVDCCLRNNPRPICRKNCNCIRGSAGVDGDGFRVWIADRITCLVITRILGRRCTSIDELRLASVSVSENLTRDTYAEWFIQYAPERCIVTAIGEDSRSDFEALTRVVVDIDLLNYLRSNRSNASM